MKGRIACIAALFYIVLAVSSCSDRFSVKSVIPNNAFFAAKLNVSDEIYKELDSALSELDIPASLVDTLRLALDNPDNALGLKLTEPIVISANYFKGNEEAFVYFASAVSDRAKATDLVFTLYDRYKDNHSEDILSSEPLHVESVDDVAVYRFGPEYRDDVTCAVSDNFMIYCTRIFCEGSQGTGATRAVRSLLSQKRSCSDVGFRRFLRSDNTMAAWVNLKRVSSVLFEDDLPMKYLNGQWPDDMTFNAKVDFEKGKTVCSVRTNCRMQKIYMRKYYNVASDRYMSMLPASTFAALNCSVDNNLFRMMWNKLHGDLKLRWLVEELHDYGVNEDFISGLPGAVTMGFAPEGRMNEDMGYVFVTECDRYVYDVLLTNFKEEGSVIEAQEGGYAFYDEESHVYPDGIMAYMRYHNGAMVVMTKGLWYQSDYGRAFSSDFLSSEFSSEISKGGAVVDISAIPSEDISGEFAEKSDLDFSFVDLRPYISSVVFTYDVESAEITLNMSDSDCTMIPQIIEILCRDDL